MLPTFKYMESATAVNEFKEPAYIYAPQTTPTSLPVNKCSTSKVAPPRQLIILRLELCAATLLAKL